MNDAAERLAHEALRLLRSYKDAGPFLAEWPTEAIRDIPPVRLPVLDWLDRLVPNATLATRGITSHLVAAAGELAWRQTYTADDLSPAFLARYGWTELAGLRGPLPSGTMASGFLLLGPEIEYPLHAHEAHEIYLVLAGTALWRKGTGPWTARAPETLVHHPSRMPHAMRTGAEPLLALYAWQSRELAAKSTFVRE